MNVIDILSKKYKIVFSPAAMGHLLESMHREEYKKGDIILDQGEIGRYLYIVEKGLIRQFYYKDGRNITEHFTAEGSIAVCLESTFKKEPTKLCVEALEDTILNCMDYAKLKKLSYQYPEINTFLQNLLEQMLIISQKKADSWRFETSHERYERFCREFPNAAQRASIAHIASYLLMAPETLSRVRAGIL